MNLEEQLLIDDFLNTANHQTAKSNQKFFDTKTCVHSSDDLLLGVPMKVIKEHIKNLPKFSLNSLSELVVSEYNEVRILGWALLARDYTNTEIIRTFILDNASSCGNWNVVDFAAPLAAKIILKNDGHKEVQNIGYRLLRHKNNVWSQRFALLLALPLVKESQFNYAMDIVERNLDSEEELIRKPCGMILKEVGKHNKNILEIFTNDHFQRMSPSIRQYLI